MGNFLYEIYQGSPTLILLNVLNVLKLLNVLTFLNVLNMPKDQSLACFFFNTEENEALQANDASLSTFRSLSTRSIPSTFSNVKVYCPMVFRKKILWAFKKEQVTSSQTNEQHTDGWTYHILRI